LQVATAKNYKLYFGDPAFVAAVREVFGRPLRVVVSAISEAGGPSAPLGAGGGGGGRKRARAPGEPGSPAVSGMFQGSKFTKFEI